MGSRRADKNLWIAFGVLIVLGLLANVWISAQLKSLENESAVSVSSSESEGLAPEASHEFFGVVAIDPDNDPLAPVVQQSSVNVVKKVDSSGHSSEPTYETSSDSPILVQ